jgi:hypothetical protein
MRLKHDFRSITSILSLALLGWAVRGAVVLAATSLFSLQATIVVDAIAAPIIFAAIAWFCFSKLGNLTPAAPALAFTLVVVFMDVLLVDLAINRSFDMFRALLVTGIPSGLIFLSTYVTGIIVKASHHWTEPSRNI